MKQVILIIAAAALLTACSKGTNTTGSNNATPSGSGYYMKFKANGTQKEFKYTTAFFFDSNSHCALNGGTNDSTGNAFTINIYPLNKKVEANVEYTGTNAFTNIPYIYFGYEINHPSGYNYGSWLPSETYTTTCHGTITEITTSYVKGTFYGKVKKANASEEIEITDGSFYLERK